MSIVARLICVASIAAAVTALSGCAGLDTAGSGPAVQAPSYRVGDRWVYHLEDGFRVKTVWDETHEITAIGPTGTTVRITQTGPSINGVRTEQWSAPGQVQVGAIYDNETRRFATPLKRYEFPLAAGKSWTQWVDDFNVAANTGGPVNYFVRVRGWDKVTTAAGTFDTIVLQVLARLDDEEFWRHPTECNYEVWYAPEARGIVKERKEAAYREKGGGLDGGAAMIRTQSTAVELMSFTPGKS